MTDPMGQLRSDKINDVERELRARLSAFCAPEVVLDGRPRDTSPWPNLIARIDAIDPATTNEADAKDLEEWGPVIARVKTFLASAKAHRIAINALTDAQELVDYDLSEGWPE